MSKSLGNFFTIRDILAEHHPEAVRYLLIASHYRSPINFSEDSLGEARQRLERFYQALQPYADVAPLPWQQARSEERRVGKDGGVRWWHLRDTGRRGRAK